MANEAAPGAQRGIQSIEVGGALLRALAHHGRALPLKELAAEAGMAPAKAHPYLVSFGKLGLIEQDPASGRYGLGPLAMQLGLISLQQLDPLALAGAEIERLAAETGHTVAIAVWGSRGATIVRVARPASAVYVSMRHGTVMSLRHTASGLLFAAHLPRARVRPLLRAEPADAGDADLEAQLAQVRAEGLARVQDRLLPGISAVAAPVFDGGGALALALTAIGPSATLDSAPDGQTARALRSAAAALSARLGWRPAA
ncbi:MAG: IclR family transcriptional regulator [Rubrivivax sp.]|nr:IclR family transcriptional regulator [Rubrivivax sp.]